MGNSQNTDKIADQIKVFIITDKNEYEPGDTIKGNIQLIIENDLYFNGKQLIQLDNQEQYNKKNKYKGLSMKNPFIKLKLIAREKLTGVQNIQNELEDSKETQYDIEIFRLDDFDFKKGGYNFQFQIELQRKYYPNFFYPDYFVSQNQQKIIIPEFVCNQELSNFKASRVYMLQVIMNPFNQTKESNLDDIKRRLILCNSIVKIQNNTGKMIQARNNQFKNAMDFDVSFGALGFCFGDMGKSNVHFKFDSRQVFLGGQLVFKVNIDNRQSYMDLISFKVGLEQCIFYKKSQRKHVLFVYPMTEYLQIDKPISKKVYNCLDFKYQIPQKIPFNVISETVSCTYQIVFEAFFKGNCMQKKYFKGLLPIFIEGSGFNNQLKIQ